MIQRLWTTRTNNLHKSQSTISEPWYLPSWFSPLTWRLKQSGKKINSAKMNRKFCFPGNSQTWTDQLLICFPISFAHKLLIQSAALVQETILILQHLVSIVLVVFFNARQGNNSIPDWFDLYMTDSSWPKLQWGCLSGCVLDGMFIKTSLYPPSTPPPPLQGSEKFFISCNW